MRPILTPKKIQWELETNPSKNVSKAIWKSSSVSFFPSHWVATKGISFSVSACRDHLLIQTGEFWAKAKQILTTIWLDGRRICLRRFGSSTFWDLETGNTKPKWNSFHKGMLDDAGFAVCALLDILWFPSNIKHHILRRGFTFCHGLQKSSSTRRLRLSTWYRVMTINSCNSGRWYEYTNDWLEMFWQKWTMDGHIIIHIHNVLQMNDINIQAFQQEALPWLQEHTYSL